MNNDYYNKLLKEKAEELEEREKEYKGNPLAGFSTNQLKSELRRRKNER